MSERKVLNKYYPPDFDPSKIPRMKLPKNRQYTVRLMAPFNMRCVTCGEYIYKGKKFNARKEDVEGQDYLGIRIYRFYIKCTRCLQEISFKTDPRNTDYEIEAGATRNFMALKLAEEQAQREEDERKEDEATNPMKLLENRTKQSKQELERLEALEEIRDLNRRQRTVDYDSMLLQYDDEEDVKRLAELQEQEDEKFIKSIFGPKKLLEAEIIEEIDADGNVIKIEKQKKKEIDDVKIKTEPNDIDENYEDNGEPLKKKKKKKHHRNEKIKENEKKLEDSIDKQLKAIREQVDQQESKKSPAATSTTTSTAVATTAAAVTRTVLSITEEIMPKKPQRIYKQETLIQTKPVHIERSTGELWNRSIGQMSKRANELNLVKPKTTSSQVATTSTTTTTIPAPAPLSTSSGQGLNALSMLGSYSGGSSDSD